MMAIHAEELKRLRPGDLLRHEESGQVYVLIEGGNNPVVVRALTVTNPTEWTLIAVSQYRPPPR